MYLEKIKINKETIFLLYSIELILEKFINK